MGAKSRHKHGGCGAERGRAMAGGGLWLCAAVLGCLAAATATARRPGERGREGMAAIRAAGRRWGAAWQRPRQGNAVHGLCCLIFLGEKPTQGIDATAFCTGNYSKTAYKHILTCIFSFFLTNFSKHLLVSGREWWKVF